MMSDSDVPSDRLFDEGEAIIECLERSDGDRDCIDTDGEHSERANNKADDGQDDDDIIYNAVRDIVKATTTPIGAQNVLKLLQKELLLALGDGENSDDCDGDEEEDDMGEVDEDESDDRIEQRVESHKKNETDKWRDLLVYPSESNAYDGR